ncbi:hypothetical protein FACS1894127_4190 [Clostridia bacterium]|nr:hypothetical protein FACS1894127_4190 [Clostridia bacterium]
MDIKDRTNEQRAREAEELSRQLLIKTEAAQAASEAKSNFLASMSHEIRTPMNTILGMSELIRTDNLDEVQLRLISDIRRMSHTLLQIINDILDYSKIEAGKLELSPSDYNIVSLIDNIYALTKISIGYKALELRYSIAPGVPKVLFGDEVRVRQIITNIVNNAVKYTNKGYVRVQLSRMTRKGVDCLAICVRDTGIGIKEEDFPRLFDAFEQANSGKDKGIIGTGLGLTITKRLLDMMGGDISFESTYGVGSEFSVFIPIMEGDESNIHHFHAINRVILDPETKVLVVDDNELNLTVAQGFLLRHGITPDTSMNGKEAIQKIKKTKYDIVFMDQMMPEMDGIEATTIIRSIEDDHCKQMPIVALTAYSIPNAQKKFLEAGMNDFIIKPIDAEELNKVLLNLLPSNKIIGCSFPETSEGSENRTEQILRDLAPVHDLDLSGGVSRVGSADVYINILRQFCKNVDQYHQEISTSLNTGDWKGYYIKMHALKTVLANIGNSRLSAWAFSLEKASKNGDYDICKAQSEGFCQDMDKLGLLLLQSTLMEETTAPRVKKINFRDLILLLDALDAECVTGNAEKAQKINRELMSISYSPEVDDAVSGICNQVDLYDFEEALTRTANLRKILTDSTRDTLSVDSTQGTLPGDSIRDTLPGDSRGTLPGDNTGSKTRGKSRRKASVKKSPTD